MFFPSEIRPVFALLFVVACAGGDEPEVVPSPVPSTLPSIPVLPSAPPTEDPCLGLTLTVPPAAGALQQVQAVASGGVGPFTYEVVDNVSGGAMQQSSGLYLAGPVPGTDTLQVHDQGCASSVSASVEILPHLDVTPASATVPPQTSFSLQSEGGSESLTCAAIDLPSGGTITSDCAYTAGDLPGVDVVEAQDPVTGETRRVELTVRDLPFLTADTLMLPVGFAHRPDLQTGSGDLIATGAAEVVAVDGRLTVNEAGAYDVVLSDPATGLSKAVHVVGAAPVTGVSERDAALLEWSRMLHADLNGDGFDELVFTDVSLSISAHNSGGLQVYPGSAAGISDTPVAVSGTQRVEYFGRGLTTGDFDGDGTLEVVVGSSGWAGAGVTRGKVTVLGAVSGPWPTDEIAVFEGVNNGDQLGYAVAACDLNDDGYDDLLMGAPTRDDRTVTPSIRDSGAVEIVFGGPTGLASSVATAWYGRKPVDNDGVWSWGDAIDLRVGYDIATGDLDGDGGCDVALGGYLGAASPTGGSSGSVTLVKGEDLLREGLPYRVVGTETATARLGRRVALRDLDGDGVDELVASARLEENRYGQVAIWRMSDLDALPQVNLATRADASVTLTGDGANDSFGWSFSIGDTPDGPGLLIGAPSDELELNGTGVVHWFASDLLVDGAALTPADATAAVSGTTGSDLFGLEVLAAPMPTASTGMPPMTVYSSRVLPLVGPRDAELRSYPDDVPLTLTGVASGLAFGTAVAFAEMDDVAGEDIVVGMSGRSSNTLIDNGAVGVVTSTGVNLLPEHPSDHSAARLGVGLQDVGDVDGDGFADFATVSVSRTRQGSLAAAFTNPDACPSTGAGSTGAVFIHRGSATGVGELPSWVAFGEAASDRLGAVAGDFDWNGDGATDLAIGGQALSAASEGGVRLLAGPLVAPADGEIQLVCGTVAFTGADTSQFGRNLAALPDLNGDGCDELVVAAPLDDVGATNTGAVRVVWGSSAVCGAPRVSSFSTGTSNSQVGYVLTAGEDVDGDGLGDVAVGNPNYIVGAGAVGGAWFLSGADIVGSTPVPIVNDTIDDGATYTPMTAVLSGSTVGEKLGGGLAFHTRPSGERVLLVGRLGALDDGAAVGRVDGWRMVDAGSSSPFASVSLTVAGEGEGSELGGALASSTDGRLAVGAVWSSVGGLDNGAVYVFAE